MKKWIALFLLVTMWLYTFSGVAEDLSPEEGDGSGEVIFVEDKIEEDFQQSLEPCEPYAPEGIEKAIIGADNRVTVSNPTQWPYSAVALMDVTGECGCHWNGSGFLVGDRGILLTAAHCLVCPDHSKWANNIKFHFGYRSSKNIYYTYTGRWVAYVGNVFADKEYSIEKDYAVVKVNEKVPKQLGWFGAYWATNDETIVKYYANVAGYRDGKIRYDSGYLRVMDADHVTFTMDEVAGNSGGPIYTPEGYAIGIIIAEQRDAYGNPINNIGYRLTYELWARVQEYDYK